MRVLVKVDASLVIYTKQWITSLFQGVSYTDLPDGRGFYVEGDEVDVQGVENALSSIIGVTVTKA